MLLGGRKIMQDTKDKVLYLASVANLTSNNEIKHQFIVDGNFIYDKFDHPIYVGSNMNVSGVYTTDLKLISGSSMANRHYISTSNGIALTGIAECKYEDPTSGRRTVPAKEVKTKHYSIVYRTYCNSLVSAIQVFSRKDGKQVLNIHARYPDKGDSNDTVHTGVYFIEKNRTIVQMISDRKRKTVSINAYKIEGRKIIKKSYKLEFRNALPSDVKVVYPAEGDKAYVMYRQENSLDLYEVYGMDVKHVQLKKADKKYSNQAVPFLVLKRYNNRTGKLEYLVSYDKELYATDRFLLRVVNDISIKEYAKYKNYTMIVKDSNDPHKLDFMIYRYDKLIGQFTREKDRYKRSLLSKRGKYLYVVTAYIKDGASNVADQDKNHLTVSKLQVKKDGTLQLVHSDNFVEGEQKNKSNDIINNLLKGRAKPYNPDDFRVSMWLYFRLSFSSSISEHNGYIVPYFLNTNYADLNDNWFIMPLVHGKPVNKLRVYNDNAFSIINSLYSNTLFVKDKHDNLFLAEYYKVYGNKALLQISMDKDRVFLFDFKKKNLSYVDCGATERYMMDTVGHSLSNKDAYIVSFRMPHEGTVSRGDVIYYKVDMSKDNIIPRKAFILPNMESSLMNSLMRTIFESIIFPVKESNSVFLLKRSAVLDSPFNVEYYIKNNKVFYVDEAVICRKPSDVRSLSRQPLKDFKRSVAYER
jgi:hypothetical protein